MMMSDLPISLLPYVGNTGYTNNDLLVFVSYNTITATTSNTTLLQHKEWILSGLTDYYITGFTYDNANTFRIFDNSGSTYQATINITTGLTVNGDFNVTGNATLNNLTANTISATTISGGTFIGNGSGLTNVQNIYNADGFLFTNRILDLSGKTLTIRQGSTGVTETLLNFTDSLNRDLFQIRSQYFLDTNNFNVITGDSPSIYIGLNAGISASGSNQNTVIGSNALGSLTGTEGSQTVIGNSALRSLIGNAGSGANTVIGHNAALSLQIGGDNTIIGQNSARLLTGGTANVLIGSNAMDSNGVNSGTSNVIIGISSGNRLTGDNNVMIGRQAGGGNTVKSSSSGNVFLGFQAGFNQTGSNLLFIENSNSSTPLVYGDFANDLLRFNAKVGVNVLPSTFQFDVNGTSRFNGDTTFGSTINGFNLANSYLAFRGTGTSGYGLAFIPYNTINTANQNISAVSIMDSTFGLIGYTFGNNIFNNLGITPIINTPGGTNLVRGVYFAPVISGLTGTTIIGFQNTVGNNLFNSISGNTGIGLSGTPTNKLHVSATTDPVRFEGLQLSNTDTRILTSDNNGVIEYRNFSDFTGSTGVNTFVTAFTYNNTNTLTISDNTGQTFNATINIVTGLTVNGNLSISNSLHTTAIITANTGTNTVYSIPTSAYTGAFFDYTVSNSAGVRAGNVMSIWSGTTAKYTEVSTTDIGDTSPITFSVGVSGGNAVLSASATTNNWVVKVIIRSI